MTSRTTCRSTTTPSCAGLSGQPTLWLSDARLAASPSACPSVLTASDTATTRGMTTTCSSPRQVVLVIAEMQVL